MYCMKMGFTIVERIQLESILHELNLEISGLLNKQDLNKIGQLLNIDIIVCGTEESIRFVDVKTGEVLILGYCEDVYTDCLKEIAKGIFNNIPHSREKIID